jgi:hypothetical protein
LTPAAILHMNKGRKFQTNEAGGETEGENGDDDFVG